MNDRGLGIRFLPLALGLLAVLFFAAKGCQEGPFGRRQIINISGDQELQLGKKAYQEILAQSRVMDDRAPLPEEVRQVGARLVEATKNPHIAKEIRLGKDRRFEWEFHVVQDKQVNAFCLPGGKVVVYTGIIPVCETDAGLAVVMGHEIGHALARHGVERMSRQQLQQIGMTAAAFSVGSMDPAQQQQVMALLGAGAKFGLELPFSRGNESEADHIGLLLMAAAGYDPSEAAKFWIRMEKATGGKGGPPSFASTHPGHEQRQRELQIWAESPLVKQLYAESSRAANRTLPRIDSDRNWLGRPLMPERPRSVGGNVEFR
jgi:predicted Zn-dependent protease